VERDRHAEDAALPGLLEDQLAVLARQAAWPSMTATTPVHREAWPSAVIPEGTDSQAWAGTRARGVRRPPAGRRDATARQTR